MMNKLYDPEGIFFIDYREFVGPIIGGGLTDLLNFRATAIVSEIILISCCACVILNINAPVLRYLPRHYLLW